MEMTPLILIILGVSGVYCDSHTMRYYYTAVSSPGSGLPVYSIVGYLDNKQIENYNSDTHQYLPKAEWMKKVEPDYWERNTQIARGIEPVYKRSVQILMNRFNQTGGIHIIQWMYGCELRDDGSTAGFVQEGYDGRDFIYLDTQRWIHIPVMYEAQFSTQRWNSPEERDGERWKNYLENQCMVELKQFIEYGREDLEKRVRPEVKVWGKQQSDGVMRLQCLVYGFHPRLVDVKWVRNGVDQVPSDEMTPILPHPDGTYQIRVSVEVPTKEGDSYSCHVNHSSLEEPLIVKWVLPSDPENGSPMAVVSTVVTYSILVVLGVIGVCFFCFPLIRKWAAKENSFPLIRKWAAKENSGSDDNFDASSYQSAPVSESP